MYGSRILLGAQTAQLAEEALEVRPIEMVLRHPEDRGLEEISELLAPKLALSDEEVARREEFWKGIIHFRAKQWDTALEHFHRAQVA